MAPSGWQLAADLSELRLVGEVDLPMLVYTYAAVNNKVAGTATQDRVAFEVRGGGGLDMVHPGWTALRDQLQNILGRTANTLDMTGQAVIHVVNTYAASDSQAASSLASAWSNGPPADPTEKKPSDPPPAVKIK